MDFRKEENEPFLFLKYAELSLVMLQRILFFKKKSLPRICMNLSGSFHKEQTEWKSEAKQIISLTSAELYKRAFEGVRYIIYHYAILHIFYKHSILPNDSIQSPGQADAKSILIQYKERQTKIPCSSAPVGLKKFWSSKVTVFPVMG